MRPLPRLLLAAAPALALVVLPAAPAPASTGAITGGTLSFNTTPPTSLSLPPTGGPCNVGTSTLDIATAGTGPTFTTTTTLAITGRDLDFGGTTVFLDISFVNRTGTNQINTTPNPDTVTLTLGATGTLRTETTPGSCTKGSTVVCAALTITLTLTGTVVPTNPPIVAPDAAGTYSLAGSGNVSAFGCVSPYTALNGKTATVSGLTATLV